MACHSSRTFFYALTRCLNRHIYRWQPLVRLSSEATGVPLEVGAPSPLPAEDRAVSERVQRLVDEITTLTLLEVSDLNFALKKKLSLPDVPVFSPGMFTGAELRTEAPASVAEPSEAESEGATPIVKTSFSLKVVKFEDSKKIALIKEIRNVISGLNLVQAKKFVDSVPAIVKEDLSKQEAEDLKVRLEKAGAICEIA